MNRFRSGYLVFIGAAVVSVGIGCSSTTDQTAVAVHVMVDPALVLDGVDATATHVSTGRHVSHSFTDLGNIVWVISVADASDGQLVSVGADGRAGGTTVVSRQVIVAVRLRQRVDVTISLDVACRNVSCPADQTCIAGTCQAIPVIGPPTSDGGDDRPDANTAGTDGGDSSVAGTDGGQSDGAPAKRTLGDLCNDPTTCGSGYCVDGVCCESDCPGSCRQCNVSGQEGNCVLVTAGNPAPSSRTACAMAAASTCRQNGLCDGNGACQLYPSGQTCAQASCDAASNNVRTFLCDGSGNCQPQTGTSCAPFRCDLSATACARACSVDNDCVGQPCVNGTCGKLGLGSGCSTAADCDSNSCVDGVCCNEACTGQCQACILSGFVGTCKALTGGVQPAGNRPGCGGLGACAGSCMGAASCTLPDQTMMCRQAQCQGTASTTAGFCDGSGACSTSTPSTCSGNLRCNAGMTTCLLSCQTDGDCASGNFCQSGTCHVSAVKISSSAKGLHTCALLLDGSVVCWGNNDFGQLGRPPPGSSSTPIKIEGVNGAIDVAAGATHACAVLSDGSIECWGDNRTGSLGDGTMNNSAAPVTVRTLGSVRTASAGAQATCAPLSSGGRIECWGTNGSGQLGNGTTVSSSIPVLVSSLTGASAFAAGTSHFCALVSGGSVDCWGLNLTGQLGNGTTTSSATPVVVTGLAGTVAAIGAGGTHSCAVIAAGKVQCWGSNGSGQLGNATTTTSLVPVAVGGLTNATAVSGGGAFTCAVRTDALVACWGDNTTGQLGNGTTASSSTSVMVAGLTNVTSVAGGLQHTCALLSNGSVRCWGRNTEGELGNGLTVNSSTPVSVTAW